MNRNFVANKTSAMKTSLLLGLSSRPFVSPASMLRCMPHVASLGCFAVFDPMLGFHIDEIGRSAR